ncbi:alpha/beta fold hydrolase [Propioniciclava coleopterorum]|uniref:Alpha/beta fold hydrolase n=1 Tax=Propioniciclava coleopterorum TaxID=2714937 RepID=A0A6G7Y8F0_9ACTN|nr:alpha/beta fold hydrolase [Propioniciclava coleopterorum]QIK72928.1 alpha/beta fold hydrolase [Propioniciclava coleopterorum]
MTIPEHARPFHADGGHVGVLLCHGFTGTPASLIEWAHHLADAGYTVSLPRLPGHGTSWQELNVTAWRDWYDHVDAAYAALRETCDTVFVAGLSMGGSLALRLAEQHPDVAGLMLVNPALGAVDPLARFAGVLKHVVRKVDSIANDIRKEGVDEGGYDVTPIAAVHELHKLWADVRSCLDLVTCPIILFRSAVDHVVPASSSDAVVRLVSSDDITEVILPNSYHVATMDHDAATVFAASVAFMQRVEAETARR